MATVRDRIEKAQRLATLYTEWAQASCDEALGYRLMGKEESALLCDRSAQHHGDRAELQGSIAQALSIAIAAHADSLVPQD